MLQSASSHSSQSGQCHLLPFKMQHVLGGLPGFASRGTRVAFTVPVARNSTFTHATSATTRGLVEGGLVTRRLELLLEALQLADDVLISTVKPRSSPLKPNECVPNTCMPVLLDVIDIIELAPLYLQRQHAPGSTWGLQRGLDPFSRAPERQKTVEVFLVLAYTCVDLAEKRRRTVLRSSSGGGTSKGIAFVPSQLPQCQTRLLDTQGIPWKHTHVEPAPVMYMFSVWWMRFDWVLS